MEKLYDTYKFEPENLYFTSDTHFGHANIIRFCNRPFATIEEMDKELVRRWNETVPVDGIVFHLGDFAYGNAGYWKEILQKLHGRKYLIIGNHDYKNIRAGYTEYFEHVTQQMSIRVGDQSIILNHNPFLCYGGSYRDVWQLFGHVHSGPANHTGLDHPRLKMLFPLQYDVGVDNNDFRPISYAEVKAKIEAQVAAARKAAGLKVDAAGDRRIVFLDPSVKPETPGQEVALARLSAVATEVIEVAGSPEEPLKAAIGRLVALMPGQVRYVYLGAEPLDDFRCVVVDRATGIVDANVDAALQIL